MAEPTNPQCSRCGGYLKVVVVRRPVYERNASVPFSGNLPVLTLLRYDEVEEVGDCFRCTGAY